MTPTERNIVEALIAVAWVDGKIADGEYGVIEGLLFGFDADENEERELLAYAKTPRSIARDVNVAHLAEADRELLLTNAVLLVGADGERTLEESQALTELGALLAVPRETFERLVAQVLASAPRR